MSPTCTWFAVLPITILLLQTASSSLDFHHGSRFVVHLPDAYQPGFAERTTVLEAAGEPQPRFAAALSVQAGIGGGYVCSLVVLLGNVTVWDSGNNHFHDFASRSNCQLELADDGELRLTDGADTVGWRSGTAGQGTKVKVLHLDSMTGNLLLLGHNSKMPPAWQSFDRPMAVLLQGQRLHVPNPVSLRLTKSSPALYQIEFDPHKITAYLVFGHRRYYYWELTPRNNATMSFAAMDVSGLTMLDLSGRPVTLIPPAVKKSGSGQAAKFFELGDDGNLGLYFFYHGLNRFKASYKALAFCELPLACGVHGVCSSSRICEDFSVYGVHLPPPLTCNMTTSYDMVEVKGVTTVLKADSPLTNLTMKQCVDQCLQGCSCAAALHVRDDDNSSIVDDTAGGAIGLCYQYGLTAGAREVIGGSARSSYWVKVAKRGTDYKKLEEQEEEYGARIAMHNKLLIIFGIVDAMAISLFVGLGVYYVCQRTVDKRGVNAEGEAAENDEGVAQPDRDSNTNTAGAVQAHKLDRPCCT